LRIRTIIDYKLRVRRGDLPSGAFGMLTEALSIPNLAKEQAQKMDQWGWRDMPDTIPLWENTREDGSPIVGLPLPTDTLVMPRGFLADFAQGMLHFESEIELIDQRTWHPVFRVGTPVIPRAWQIKQIEAIIAVEQGIVKSPAGSGKTVAVLEAIRALGCQSLIIVNTKDIMWQWQERVTSFLGEHYPVGQIGDREFEVSPYITIATAQTLHRRFDLLEEGGFFDQFSFVCLDECHHATAETYNKILSRFSSRFRIGVSATPDKTGDFAMATNVLGPIIHTTKPSEVTTLTKPVVVKVPTKFGFKFMGQRSRWQRSNYPQMIDALIKDPERNGQIVRLVRENSGHHQLLVSKRLEHLAIIQDLLEDGGFSDPIVTITGQDDSESRQGAVDLANEEPCLILSTLADEALDIPRLDRIYLVFPQKNAGLVTQQVGRVERVHPDKKDAIVFDFADMNVGPLEKQWRTRRFEVYEPRGYKIETRKVDP
jgi:superfamily II DNA or RNA helicase